MRWSLLLLVASGCTVPTVALSGKQCTASHACPSGLTCNPYTFTCTNQTGCPLYPPESFPSCSSTTLYVSPGGSDANPGTDPAAPRQTLNGLTLAAGTVVTLLPGAYGQTLQNLPGGGIDGCPLTLTGLDGGAVVQYFGLDQSHWRIRDLTVDAPSTVITAVDVVNSPSDIVFERLRFRRSDPTPPGNGARDLYINNACNGCAVVSCDFQTNDDNVYEGAGGQGFTVRGNRFVATGTLPIWINSAGALIEGNEFTGSLVFSAAVSFSNGALGSGRVVRNLFHDLTADQAVVQGAEEIESNTFASVAGGGSAAADTAVVFRDNLLTHIPAGLTSSRPPDAGYNLFDGVGQPYTNATMSSGLAPTDLAAPAGLGSTFTPLPGSAALDAADPTLPVPPGGGVRADIGAKERGATALPDGRYCVPEPQ